MMNASALGRSAGPLEILLLASEPGASKVAHALAERLEATVRSVPDARRCLEVLQSKSFTLLILEETVMLEAATVADALYEAAGPAVVLEVNFGLSDADRIVRQVRSVLVRRRREQIQAKTAVLLELRNELNASVSGLLLKSQVALKNAAPELTPSLQHLVALAEGLCSQLRN